jgi:hypothetical protein
MVLLQARGCGISPLPFHAVLSHKRVVPVPVQHRVHALFCVRLKFFFVFGRSYLVNIPAFWQIVAMILVEYFFHAVLVLPTAAFTLLCIFCGKVHAQELFVLLGSDTPRCQMRLTTSARWQVRRRQL